MTHKLHQNSSELYKEKEINTISIIVIENEQDWQPNLGNADVVITLNDIENKDYSIIQQAFGACK